ncbi:MAG: glycosyltransferase family 2 protein [Rhodanobacteraceae bacterium]
MPLSTSIVLCTYNGASFLGVQWASLLAQSTPPDEIVVRDDASSDATLLLLEDLTCAARARGVRVRLARNPRNVGYVANFEAALRAASGDVLFLCDQDDLWHTDKLATMVAEFQHRPMMRLLCSDARRVDESGASLRRSLFEVLKVSRDEVRRIHAGRGFEVLLRRSLATGATLALRRTLLSDALPFPEGWVHDEWLAIVAAALGAFDCVEARLIDYRQHGSNQIGMPERDLAAKWQDLSRPRSGMIDDLVARDEVLLQRLRALGPVVPAGCIEQTLERLRHLRLRAMIAGPPWARFGRVLREAATGRYRRHGTGWRSALRDLVRHD